MSSPSSSIESPERAGPHEPSTSRAPLAYVGRFAPSPTGPLHAGSLVAAMASYLDARAQGGRWLLRIEDLDPPREVAGASQSILDTLTRLGFEADGPITWQHARLAAYSEAFDDLVSRGWVYPCACTRKEIADSADANPRARFSERVYPGTCRNGLPPGKSARAWRMRVGDAVITWQDRSGRESRVVLAEEAGDFVLKRADGLWAYQLAVVVDDAWQQVTDVVRGEDLFGATARQIHLQHALGVATPRYLHVPVVNNALGEKLSKQTGAAPIDLHAPVRALNEALVHLGLPAVATGSIAEFWRKAISRWRRTFIAPEASSGLAPPG